MKIILVTDYFYPLSSGGTEKYVYLLAKHLLKQNDVRILSISNELTSINYENLEIDYVFPNTDSSNKVIRGITPANNIKHLETYLKQQNPDIVHFHTLTTNFNHFHIIKSYQLGFKTYYTSHIPGDQCPKGDFIYKGKKPCDGIIERNKCTKCICFSNQDNLVKKITKYLFYSLLKENPVDLKLLNLKKLELNTHKIIAVCEWQKNFFIKNKITANHLVICRHAITKTDIHKSVAFEKVRLGYLGRIDPVKGLHLLIDALSQMNSKKYTLTIGAIPPPQQHLEYFNSIKRAADSLSSCKLTFNLTPNEIYSFFSNIDYLVVPSLVFETGPFVIYEALAAGIPIITTNMGGQKELIRNGENGYTFEPNISCLIAKLNELENMAISGNFDLNRNEEAIANEMSTIYYKN